MSKEIVEAITKLEELIKKEKEKIKYEPIKIKADSYMRTKAFQKISKTQSYIEEVLEGIANEELFFLTDILNNIRKLLTFTKEDIKNGTTN